MSQRCNLRRTIVLLNIKRTRRRIRKDTIGIVLLAWGRRGFVVVVFDRVVRPSEPIVRLEAHGGGALCRIFFEGEHEELGQALRDAGGEGRVLRNKKQQPRINMTSMRSSVGSI